MQDELALILETLKSNGWPAYKIEKQLGLSNGVLGKTAAGKKAISADNFKLVVDFYSEIIKNAPSSPTKKLFSLSDLTEADLETISQYLELKEKYSQATATLETLTKQLKDAKEAEKIHFDPYARLPWAAEIEQFCSRNGLDPETFVAEYKRLKQIIKNQEDMLKFYGMAFNTKAEAGEIPESKVKFIEEMRKRKLGY